MHFERAGRNVVVRFKSGTPFTKKKGITKVTVTLGRKQTFFGEAPKETMIIHKPFMEALVLAQQKWPGKPIMVQSIGWTPPKEEGKVD